MTDGIPNPTFPMRPAFLAGIDDSALLQQVTGIALESALLRGVAALRCLALPTALKPSS
ncbi:hypothetical protein [Luteibacter aegosomatissinici]|uniref:hypothetical protein n=1 Tax=Luteibacter aegosomatissinici TaxID=2911539 RepID=UPI001FF85C6A|nr:hypothetical protein [Luteibacter aegosomatissinici]UPG92762.1 hypothetical protein L2Y97_12895 [Luteibacter aegosomatissinici]